MTGTKIDHQFDWYQATVPAHHELLCSQLLAAMGEGAERVSGKGMWSYKHSSALMLDDEVAARVLHGGVNPHPNVVATGDHGSALAAVLRTVFPDHRVSRADVCIDMRGDGLFDDISSLMGKCGRKHRLKGEKIIPDDLDDGSTYYLGSRSSPLRVRCYEKGKQLYKLTGDVIWRDFFDWTRLELQVRPEKDFKSTAAKLSPEEFWGCAEWTRELSAGALGLDAETISMKPARISDHERAMRALSHQYGATILRQIQKLGTPEDFLADILRRIGFHDAQCEPN